MHNHDQEFLCIIAAVCLGAAGGNVPTAVAKAEEIQSVVKQRHPDDVMDSTDLRSDRR
jgi:hypothetical protein